MSSQRDDDDDTRPVVWAVLIGAIVLAVGLAMGFGISKSMKGAKSAAPAAEASAQAPAGAASAASDAAPAAAVLGDDESRVVVEGGAVKFYFASGKAALAEGADAALGAVIIAVGEGKKAVVSGYHDTTGSAELNAELSKQRAIAVRDALVRLGVAEDKVDLRKPEETAVQGNSPEARRVEVTLE